MQRFFTVFLMLLLVLSFSGCITQSPESILEERRLRTAVRIHPEHEMGYLRLAQFLENQRRYAETLYVLKQGQQRVPDSLLMVRLEGSLYQSQDDKEKIENHNLKFTNMPSLRMTMTRSRSTRMSSSPGDGSNTSP